MGWGSSSCGMDHLCQGVSTTQLTAVSWTVAPPQPMGPWGKSQGEKEEGRGRIPVIELWEPMHCCAEMAGTPS